MDLKEQKLTDIRKNLDALISDIGHHCSKGSKMHKVELHIFKHLLSLGLSLLEYYVLMASQLVKYTGTPKGIDGEKMYNTGLRTRQYFSVFGQIQIRRAKYYSNQAKTYYALDDRLGLPCGRYSYILSDWLSYGSVEVDFSQSVKQLERILGHQLNGMQSSRQTYHLSQQVESYYQQRNWPLTQDGTHLSVGYDGKGIPIIRSQTQRKEESSSVRLAKGKKKGVKREATISVSSSFTPKQRGKEQILSGLFSAKGPMDCAGQGQAKHPWHKHIRAFLSDKARAIAYGIDNLLDRDTTATKPIVVLIDGDRALEKAVRQVCEQKQIGHRVDAYILDFIHLLEYVWKVANAYLGENSTGREAWVRQQAELLLDSQHELVLSQWKQIKASKKLRKNQLYNIERAMKYLGNRPHMVDYKTYLSKGYPITTGAVESACGHFIKSRMDRTAMHWGKQGAQKMLNIRAIKKNDDWQQYMQYFIENEQNTLYNKAA